MNVRDPNDIADDIEAAMRWHNSAFPDGDYKAANQTLTRLFWECEPILMAAGVDPWRGGHEGRVRALRDIAALRSTEQEAE